MQLRFGAGGESIDDQSTLVRPPAIDGGFADVRIGGDGLDGKIGKPGVLQEFQRAAQNGLARMFAPRASRQALRAVVRVVVPVLVPRAVCRMSSR